MRMDRSAGQRHRYRRRVEMLTGHVVSSSRRLQSPPLGPGRHTVAGHPTVLPNLDDLSVLDNALATAEAVALPNRGPLRLVNGRPDPAILDAFNEYGFYILEGSPRVALPRIHHLFVKRMEQKAAHSPSGTCCRYVQRRDRWPGASRASV